MLLSYISSQDQVIDDADYAPHGQVDFILTTAGVGKVDGSVVSQQPSREQLIVDV
jgi:hypothetical protein